MKSKRAIAKVDPMPTPDSGVLVRDLRELIQRSRQMVSRGVNAALALLHWQVGQRVRTDLLRQKRAEYGHEIVALRRQLSRTHFKWILCLKDLLQHEFHLSWATTDCWSVHPWAIACFNSQKGRPIGSTPSAMAPIACLKPTCTTAVTQTPLHDRDAGPHRSCHCSR